MPKGTQSWLERMARVIEDVWTPDGADTLRVEVPTVTGTWGYVAGDTGTATLPAGARVLQISAQATSGGPGQSHSIAIDGGTAIPLPASASVTLTPRGNLVGPTIVFTNTAAYFVEYVE